MTKEQMEQFDPMDRVDIEVERGVYQGNIEIKSNHLRPFSKGSIRTESIVSKNTHDWSWLKEEQDNIINWHKENNTGLI